MSAVFDAKTGDIILFQMFWDNADQNLRRLFRCPVEKSMLDMVHAMLFNADIALLVVGLLHARDCQNPGLFNV
jgi:hypothetical protein